jgi:glucose-1-phosphate cytidylyltransferase
MKVVILCGGFGTRLREETEIKPKPMVEIGGKPILWHIMKTFAHHGYDEFVLCLGYKGDMIKNYFLNYAQLNNDFSIELGSGNIQVHDNHEETEWKVTLVNTGPNAMTGARVKRIERYIDGDQFLLTYGDGVTDLNINELVDFHKSRNKIGTVTGVAPPSHYGELDVSGDDVVSFQEKPNSRESFISGGYFVFNREIFRYLSADDACVLERAPLEILSKDGQLSVYGYSGFWQCMDTYRDYMFLNELWDQGDAKWKVWDSSKTK